MKRNKALSEPHERVAIFPDAHIQPPLSLLPYICWELLMTSVFQSDSVGLFLSPRQNQGRNPQVISPKPHTIHPLNDVVVSPFSQQPSLLKIQNQNTFRKSFIRFHPITFFHLYKAFSASLI